MVELTLEELKQFRSIFCKIQKRAEEIIKFKNDNDNICRTKFWENRYSDDDCSITDVYGKAISIEFEDSRLDKYDHDIKFNEFISDDWHDEYCNKTMTKRLNRDWELAIVKNNEFKTEEDEYERLKKIYGK